MCVPASQDAVCFLGHWLFGLVSFFGVRVHPPLWFCAKKNLCFCLKLREGSLNPTWQVNLSWSMIYALGWFLKLAICFRIDYCPAGPGGIEYCFVILSYICSRFLGPFHCQMDDLHEWKPQFLIQMSSIIIHMSTYFCMSLEQKHQRPSSKQCLWKDPTLSEKKCEITNSNTKRGIHLRKTNMKHKKMKARKMFVLFQRLFFRLHVNFREGIQIQPWYSTSFQPPAPWPSISYGCTWSKTRCSVTWRLTITIRNLTDCA